MVGGIIYFRGPIQGYSEKDVKLVDLTPQDWEWLKTNIKPFLETVDRTAYYMELTRSADSWKNSLHTLPMRKGARKNGPKIPALISEKNNWGK